jgi:hypothetical protein
LVRLQVPAEGLRLRENAVTALYYAVWLLPALACGAVILMRRIVEREVGALVVMAVVTQCAVNITMLRDPLANRIRDVIVPAAAVTAALIGMLWLRGRGRGGVLRLGARAIAVVLLAAFVVVAGVIGEATPRTTELLADGWGGIQRRARGVSYRLSPPQHRTGGELNEAYLRLVNYIRRCTPERSRVLTLAFVPELFIYTGREFAGGHMAFTEGYYVGERHESLALQRLRAEDVPLVILDAEIRTEMAASHPRIWEYVMQRYRPAGEFPIRPGRTMAVLAETSRPVRSRFEGSTLPCFQANI